MLWKRRLGSGAVYTSPVCEHGLLIVVTNKGRLSVVNRYTGEQLREIALDSNGQEGEYSACVQGQWLVAGGQKGITGFNLLDAFHSWDGGPFNLSVAWNYSLPDGVICRPLYLTPPSTEGYETAPPSVLVVAAQGDGSRTYCLGLSDGKPRWDEPVVFDHAASALVPGEADAAFVLTSDGGLSRVDLAHGTAQSCQQLLTTGPRLDLGPAWQDGTLFFFDTEGALCVCQTHPGSYFAPMRASEHTLQVVKGFALSPKGILVSCSRGLAMLSRTGRRQWIGEGGMDAGGAPPIIAGDAGFGTGQNRNLLYYCDIRGTSPLYKPFPVTNEPVVAGMAFAGGLLYVTTMHGEVSCLQVERT